MPPLPSAIGGGDDVSPSRPSDSAGFLSDDSDPYAYADSISGWSDSPGSSGVPPPGRPSLRDRQRSPASSVGWRDSSRGGFAPSRSSRSVDGASIVSRASRSSRASVRSASTSVATNRWRRDALAFKTSQMLEHERSQREAAAKAERARLAKLKRGGILGMLKGMGLGAGGSKSNAGGLALEDDPMAKRPGISRAGPHPAEAKRAENLPPSVPIEEVNRRALALIPKSGNPREGTDQLLTVLEEYAGFEVTETTFDRSDLATLRERMLDCGVVVNGMDVVEPALWKEFRDARAAGVLVMNCDHPGLYLAHTSHVDVPAAVPKYVAPYRVNLAERCETREDGYREVMIHVVSGPDMEAERLLLRNRVLPMLTERCRTRRVRPIYVDLRDDAAGCGPGLAVRAAEVAREGAVHVVLLSGKHEPETHANERLKTFIEKIPRGGAQAKFDWMRFAPQDYSRLEYVVAQILHLADEPAWMRIVGGHERQSLSSHSGSTLRGNLSTRSGSTERSGRSLGDDADARLAADDDENEPPEAETSVTSRSSLASFSGKKQNPRVREIAREESSRSLRGLADGLRRTDSSGSLGGLRRTDSSRSLLSMMSGTSGSSGGAGGGSVREDDIAEAQATLEEAEVRGETDAQNLAAALKRASIMSEQHVLAYVRDCDFASQVPDEELDEFFSSDPYERERVGAVLSALYAHPQVAVRPYHADYAPPTDPGGGGFVSGVPGHATNLNDFAADALEDIWSRVSHEFPANPSKDIIAWHEREPEFTLQTQLPFYFSRSVQEHTIVRCVKLGRPRVIAVTGRPGSGVTSLMQRCARECRRLYGNLDGRSRDEVVVLSIFTGVGRARMTPTQMFRSLAASLKAHCLHPHDIPGEYNGARAALLTMIRATITINRRVAIFIDAFTAVDNPRGIAWLLNEAELPAGVQVVVGGHQTDEKLAQALIKDRAVLTTARGVLEHVPEKLLRVQHAAMTACVPEAVEQMMQLRPMQYLERKLYIAKHLKLVNVELEETVLTELLNKPALASITYARMLVEMLCSFDLDTLDVVKHVDRFPVDADAMLRDRLRELEMIFPKSTLALILPTLALGCNSLTLEDIMAVMVTTLEEDEEAYLDSIIAPALLWEARHFVSGPFDGTYKIASDAAARTVLDRYVPDEKSKRAAFRMLAEYFGDLDEDADDYRSAYDRGDRDGHLHADGTTEDFDAGAIGGEMDGEGEDTDRTRRRPSPGRGLLARMHQISSRALEKDGEAQITDPEAFQEHHLVVDAIHLLPYYLTQARMFGELCALLRDFSFLQAKLELGEGAALVEDFDRVLRGPRPAWIEEWDGGDHRPGTSNYFAAKRLIERTFQSECRGFDAESFRRWMGDQWGDADSAHGDLIAYRNLIWRNLPALHRRPHTILQVAMNAPGDAEPGAAAEDKVRQLSPPPYGPNARTPGAYCFSDADPGEEYLLLWGNRPDEAPVREMRERDVHAGPVTACAWVDDGCFVTGCDDGMVAMWSTATGECAARMRGHEHAVTAALCADVPTQGRRVVTASRDGTVRVWKYEGDMGKTCQTLSGHTDHVTSLAFAPDAGELVSVGCDGRVVVWDLTAPVAKQLHRIQSAHTGPIHAVAMSPDGTAFVTGAADKTVHVWSTTPPAKGGGIRGARPAEKTSTTDQTRGEHVEPEVTLKLQGHLSDVTCCAFGRTAASLATGSLDHSVMLWNPSAGTHVGILVGHAAPVCDVSYSRDGRFLVSASRDHHVRLWHPRSGETVLTLRQSAGALTARLSPDASRLLVGADDASVSVWGWIGREGSASMGQNPQRPRLFARGHALRDDDAETAATDALGSLTDRSDGSGRSRHTASSVGRKVDRNPLAFDGQAHKGAMNCVAAFFAPSEDDAPNSSTAGSSADGSPGGSSSAARRDRERARREKMAARLPVLTGGDDGYLRKISTIRGETGKVTMTFKGHAKAIRAVAASPDMSTAVSASDDGTLMLWDTQTGLDSGVLAGHEGPALACCYSTDGRRVLSGGKDRAVRIWDTTETGGGAQLDVMRAHTGRVTALASARGDVYASASADRTCVLWDVAAGCERAVFRGHVGGLTYVALSGDDAASVALTTAVDYTARAWDARDSRRGEIRALRLSDPPTHCASCPGQSAWWAVCAGDGVHVFDARTWREVAYFQGLAKMTCAVFQGTGRMFAGDRDGRAYALDAWKAPARSWV